MGTQPHWPCHLSAHGHTGAAVAPALTQERRTLFLLPQTHRQPHPVPHEACFVPASVSPAFLPRGVAAGANTCVKIVGFRKIVINLESVTEILGQHLLSNAYIWWGENHHFLANSSSLVTSQSHMVLGLILLPLNDPFTTTETTARPSSPQPSDAAPLLGGEP